MITRYLTLASLGLVVALASGCGKSAAPNGKAITATGTTNFTPKTGGFSIYFPSTPTERTEATPAGGETLQTTIYQSETAPVVYMVVATTLPSGVDLSDSKNFIDSAQKGMLESSKAELVKSEDIHLNDTPGRELHTTMLGGGALCRVRIYLTPKVSYSVMAVGAKDKFNASTTEIEKVLNSFKLASG